MLILRKKSGRGRLPAERDVERQLPAAAVNLELHGLTRLVLREHVPELFERRDTLASDRDDQVAAERVALTRDDPGRVARLHACARSRCAFSDVLDEHAGVDREPELARELLVDGGAADAEIGAIDAAGRDELCDDLL